MLHRTFPEESDGEVRDRRQGTEHALMFTVAKVGDETCTLVFSLSHKGAIKKLDHGILLLVLRAAESKTGRTSVIFLWL